jgi:hypothetical protein
VPGSLLVASLLRGLPCPVLPQESSRLPLQSTECNIHLRLSTYKKIRISNDFNAKPKESRSIRRVYKACSY